MLTKHVSPKSSTIFFIDCILLSSRKFRDCVSLYDNAIVKILFDLFPVVTTDHIFTSSVVIVFSLPDTLYNQLSVEICSNKDLIQALDDTGMN